MRDLRAGGWLTGMLLLASLHAGCSAAPNPAARFQITTDRPANRVTYSLDEQTAIFDVASPGGIGEAAVTWQDGPHPERILLRFHLHGLEELRLTDGDKVQTLAMPTTGDGLILQTVAPAKAQTGAERKIAPGDPDWLPTRVISATTGSTIPLMDGFIEVELPPQLLNQANRSFTMHWVDFFR